MVRLTTLCNLGCEHCTIRDILQHGERSSEDCAKEILEGRKSGCTELVFMRGEVTTRREFPALVRFAKRAGYTLIQVQTNGRMLADEAYFDRIVAAGANFFEVSVFGSDAGRHDTIGRDPGAFEQTMRGLARIVSAGVPHMVTVPVIRATVDDLLAVTELMSGLGVQQIQYNFNRPFRVDGDWFLDPVVRLDECSGAVREAMRRAREQGMWATTEAIPLCHLDADDATRYGGDIHTDFGRIQVSDIHIKTDSMAEHRTDSRPTSEACSGCVHERYCPRTWKAYQEIFGTSELRRILAIERD